ncbi:hypothetical protein GGX14DRAFT_400626 [Mycena pura]|uniref:F-box domain-containing protein n=1 Tax=Mycena pura TaxID=153505 RepID=A0AAD6V4L0_9AGAR|nr:hypothetical protein GGX14DRAFT_400626 [Mycena pura]
MYMHRCLRIHEIITEISSHFDSSSESGDLSALARTCHAFQDPALDELWRTPRGIRISKPEHRVIGAASRNRIRRPEVYGRPTQETIHNVIRCFPQDIFETTLRSDKGIFGQTSVVLRRSPENADWARPLFYSSRVRIFTPHIYRGSVTFGGFRLDPPGGSWFPRLRTLNWNIDSMDDASIRPFLSPQLERVSFRADVAAFHLSRLPTFYPHLKHLVLGLPATSNEGSDRISACITQLMHLESLRGCSLTLAAVNHIGVLATLKSLELESLPSKELSVHGALPARLFKALVSLQLYHADVGSILTFLHACAGALTKLSVWVNPDETMSEAQLVEFSAVVLSWRRTLTSLRVSGLGAHIANDPPYTLNDNTLRPLCGLRHLTSVCIVTPTAIGLSDAGILELSRSWTHLTFLVLGSTRRTRTVRPTLAALASIAKFCPKLRHLDIVVDASTMPLFGDPAFYGFSQRELKVIWLKNSPISNPTHVARYLAQIFPALQTAWTDFGESERDSQYAAAWAEVRSYLWQTQ